MYKDITFCKETDEEDYFDGFLGWKLKSASLMLNKDMKSLREFEEVKFWFQSILFLKKNINTNWKIQNWNIGLIWFDS